MRRTDFVDPARMPLTRLANAAIDAVADNRDAVIEEVAKYLGSDLVCYRAEAPAGLVERQTLPGIRCSTGPPTRSTPASSRSRA